MRCSGSVRRGLVFAGLVLAVSLGARAAPAADGPVVGSGDVAAADPPLPRPPGRPCEVALFSDVGFTDFAARPFSYSPPASCRGPWAKVVLEGDFSVTAGRQFDRTASIWLGGVNLYFGTTQEPSAALAPHWHVERDLTDYAALLRTAGAGQAIVGNVVDATYTGVIHGSARLLFYPAGPLAPAPAAPDVVYPLGSDPVGSTVALADGSARLARSLSLPRNVERAYLDVFVQSQNADEFWYTCVPDAYAEQVQSCGGGAFREAQVSIDGQAAGIVPVQPWIYTGGIDPYLWRPTPGVQTLNFLPYRVDLTPFAGTLSDGAAHEVAVSVAGADDYFSATAALLVYRDPRARQTSGKVTRNTLAGQTLSPTVTDTLSFDASGNGGGDIATTSRREAVIEGYVDTSHGRVRTQVTQTVAFSNRQHFTLGDTVYRQTIDQGTRAERTSRSWIGAVSVAEYREQVSYPLYLDYDEQVSDDGIAVATTVRQGFDKHLEARRLGLLGYSAMVGNHVETRDTLDYDAAGSTLLGHDGSGRQDFSFGDSLGGCYRASVASADGLLTDYSEGRGCPGGGNRVAWFAQPDGAPDSRSQAPAL
jgi:hypothetical protein